jgi:hypothetical protein
MISGLQVVVRSTGPVCNPRPQSSRTMQTHPNARLTPLGRVRLVCRHIGDCVPLAEMAAKAGISLRLAYK